MYLQLQQKSVMLGRRPSGFVEHYYTEWDDGLGNEKISLFLVMSIGSTQVPGAEIGKEAFQLLQDHFLDDLTGDPYDRFENALREINIMIQEKEEGLGVKFVPNMHVICGVIQKDALYLSQRGDAQGYLVRKRHVSSITEGLYDEKNTDDLFQNIASGALEVGDSVILTTGHLVQFVTPNDLSKIFSEQALNEAMRELSDLLGGDLDEQMAVLSFEILEKAETEFVASAISDGADDEEDGEERALREDREEEMAEKKRVRRERLNQSVSALRGWLTHEERWAWVRDVKSWPRKKLLTVIGALAAVLIVGVLVLSLFTGQQKQLDEMNSKLALAEENVTQADTRGAFDKTEAAMLLDEAESLAVEVLNSGLLGGQASQLLDKIDQQREYLDNVVYVDDEVTLVTDFSSLVGTDSIVDVEQYNDRIVVFTSDEAYQVMLGEAQAPSGIDSAERVVSASYFGDRGNIVMLTASGRIMEYTDGNSQFADNSDGAWVNGIDVSTYSSKIYVLDPAGNQIWKYQRGTSAYGSGVSYLAEGADVSKGVSLAVDGNVWVLNSDGTISRFLSGDVIDFNVKDAPLVPIDGAVQIYTELEITQLYVLDSANSRILVYNKSSKTDDLTYSQQYVFSDLRGKLVDMYVDKDRDVIMFVTDQALYELGF